MADCSFKTTTVAAEGSLLPSTRPQRFYRPELDILRFLAFLAVFITHSSIFPSGLLAEGRKSCAFGLSLFFFLSGFLITELLSRERETTGTVRLGAFYMRRILRIWPLHFAALLFDFAHAQWRAPALFPGKQLAAYLLLVGNWWTARHGLGQSLTLPLWSISVEEQFYLLWPSVQRRWSRETAIRLASATVALSAVAIVYQCRRGDVPETALWVNSFVQFQFFATGALSALMLRHRTPRIGGWQRVLLFFSGLAAMFLAQAVLHVKFLGGAQSALLVPGYLLVNLGCATLFFSVLGAQQLGRARPLIYLGKISYGLYVFHYPALVFLSGISFKLTHGSARALSFDLRAALALPCTIGLAHLSYKYFEAPILRYKQRFEVIRTRPVASEA